NYSGSDSFTYTANDGFLDSNVATVTITVSAVDDAPVAVADSDTTAEDTAVTVDVLGNDTDVDGGPIAVTAVTDGAHGTVVNNGSDVTYTPAADFNGID